MRLGVPKETKTHEYRVGMTPTSVREAVHRGHEVFVESGAGAAIGLDDERYRAAGARIVDSGEEVFAAADVVVKVKEPQPAEYPLIREGQVLFTYLHLAPDPLQTAALLERGCIAIAYETVTDSRGRLPLLAPMSDVAGRMSIQVGAHCLELEQGGRGVLLGGMPGVPPAKVVVLGGGNVGANAARMAVGLGAHVTVLDISMPRLYELEAVFGPSVYTVHATLDAIETEITGADLVIGAVLVPGAAAPRIVTRDMVGAMKRGSVVVDVAIDQGGCFETSRPTNFAEPTYRVDDVVHYCVTNMPGAVARTSTFALNSATLPFIIELAEKGHARALGEDPHFAAGLNVCRGRITHPAVAAALNRPYTPPGEALAG